MSFENFDIKMAPLGKKTDYPTSYNPSVLFKIPRDWARQASNNTDLHGMLGFDIWHDYEFVSHSKIYKLKLIFDANSKYLVESKSLKLYLYSFATHAASEQEILETITRDLSLLCESKVLVSFDQFKNKCLIPNEAENLDQLECDISKYDLNSALLKIKSKKKQTKSWYTQNFRSNCLVSGKPDVATVLIEYEGPEIEAKDLYCYLISFRQHLGIHEQCIERIYKDIMQKAHPDLLKVSGFYTRRGGLDIHPIRYNSIYQRMGEIP